MDADDEEVEAADDGVDEMRKSNEDEKVDADEDDLDEDFDDD